MTGSGRHRRMTSNHSRSQIAWDGSTKPALAVHKRQEVSRTSFMAPRSFPRKRESTSPCLSGGTIGRPFPGRLPSLATDHRLPATGLTHRPAPAPRRRDDPAAGSV